VQSVPRLQSEYSAPAPPSSQLPSEAKMHVSVQVCALAKPNIRVRKSTPASRGADPKRPEEQRRAEGRQVAALRAGRPSGDSCPVINVRAEVPHAAQAWTAPYSTAQSTPSIASRPGREAAPVVDERAYGMEPGAVSCATSAMSTLLFALKASSCPPRYLMMETISIVWMSSIFRCIVVHFVGERLCRAVGEKVLSCEGCAQARETCQLGHAR